VPESNSNPTKPPTAPPPELQRPRSSTARRSPAPGQPWPQPVWLAVLERMDGRPRQRRRTWRRGRLPQPGQQAAYAAPWLMSAGPRQAPYEITGANVTKLSRRDHRMGWPNWRRNPPAAVIPAGQRRLTGSKPARYEYCDQVNRITESQGRRRLETPEARCIGPSWRRYMECRPPAEGPGYPASPLARSGRRR
jgi:hypothetical protein